jgi:hypothetical protein
MLPASDCVRASCRSTPKGVVRPVAPQAIDELRENKAANIAGDIRITPSAIVGQTNLQPSRRLVHQHQARSIPDQNLDPVRSLRAEHEGCAAERVEMKHLLHLRRKPIVSTAEVDRPRGNVQHRPRSS